MSIAKNKQEPSHVFIQLLWFHFPLTQSVIVAIPEKHIIIIMPTLKMDPVMHEPNNNPIHKEFVMQYPIMKL